MQQQQQQKVCMSNLEPKKAQALHIISLINKDKLSYILRIKDMNSFQQKLHKLLKTLKQYTTINVFFFVEQQQVIP